MATCDVLIIGSGIAGLSIAIKLSKQFPEHKIYIVTKGDELESNTSYAQGGISAVCDVAYDSFENHIEDTLKAGDGLCNRQVVEKVIRHAQTALLDLTSNGVDLDKDEKGNFLLGREGGHSQSRIVHFKDMTGFQIASSLLRKVKTMPGIILLSDHIAIDLITEKHLSNAAGEANECFGAFILNSKTMDLEKIISKTTVLATGGIGQVYNVSTNPKIATGDGIAMAYRAGASMRDMEFIQFHPTAFYTEETDDQTFLITEALRGYGGLLVNHEGHRFMFDYDTQGELACRDVVARAVENEIKTGRHPCVFLDCTHLPSEKIKKDFPKIYSFCLAKGINITAELIPVIPAAHYLCGGIAIDSSGRTSIDKLYALGECAYTGLHGANRLASNSLLEAVAFADFCFQDIRKRIKSIAINENAVQILCPILSKQIKSTEIAELRKKVQKLMTSHVGINRTTTGLQFANESLELIETRLYNLFPEAPLKDFIELRNILITAKLIVIHSLNRKINKGSFYNVDLEYELHN